MQVKKLLASEADMLAKYAHSLAESWVDDNASVRWCPSVPCCGRAISVAEDVHCQPECRSVQTSITLFARHKKTSALSQAAVRL